MREDVSRYLIIAGIMLVVLAIIGKLFVPMSKLVLAQFKGDTEQYDVAQNEVMEAYDEIYAPVTNVVDAVEDAKQTKEMQLQKAIENGYTLFVNGKREQLEDVAIKRYNYSIDDTTKSIYCESKNSNSLWWLCLCGLCLVFVIVTLRRK
ncbi:MAG: hypothetical protein IKP66_09245 [Lachnospiraceae bacterium]|nr:hypothetical protein [Lachnospiraceae bacterium]